MVFLFIRRYLLRRRGPQGPRGLKSAPAATAAPEAASRSARTARIEIQHCYGTAADIVVVAVRKDRED